jgi:BirA family transcriptional regulator, biotin operon repressor / biotin---[acetyl-CoA-carboxylase] ligase
MTTLPESIWSFSAKHLGLRTLVYECLDSTNTLALSLADEPAQHGLVVMARAQTAGRGQYGRAWQAPPGSSVLMSVLLFPPLALRRPALLTAWAAVSVCEAIANLTNLQASIKWPNDVLVAGKKVCGILIEQRTTGHADFPLATVVGIGLNLTQSAAMFEEAGLPLAASLAITSGQSVAYEGAAKELIRQLDEHYCRLLAGDFGTLEARWKARLGLVGQVVLVEGASEHHRGRLLDVSLTGLQLDVGAGEVLRLTPESVRHLHLAE